MIAARKGVQDRVEYNIFDTLRRIIRAVSMYSTALKEQYGLSSSQLSCLLVLKEKGAISLSKMSKIVSLSPSMITGIIDRLESKEFVKRVRNSSDRRVITIELTKKGKRILKKAPASFQIKLIKSLGKLGSREKSSINRNLEKLLSIILQDVLMDSSILRMEKKITDVQPTVIHKKSTK